MKRNSYSISRDIWREMLIKGVSINEFSPSSSPNISTDSSFEEENINDKEELNVDSFQEIDDSKEECDNKEGININDNHNINLLQI